MRHVIKLIYLNPDDHVFCQKHSITILIFIKVVYINCTNFFFTTEEILVMIPQKTLRSLCITYILELHTEIQSACAHVATDFGEVRWPLPWLLVCTTRFSYRGCLNEAGLFVVACWVKTFPLGVLRDTKQASFSSLTMTRPREPETADSLTDSAEESELVLPWEVGSLPESTQNNAISPLAKETSDWSYGYVVNCGFRWYSKCISWLLGSSRR